MNNIDFHADDYGITLNNSKRILELVRLGKLDSFSIIPNMSGYTDSIELLRSEWDKLEKKPRIAVHINLIDGFWLSKEEKTPINNSWGALLKRSLSSGQAKKDFIHEIKNEISSQVSRVYEDLKDIIDYISLDSHVHTHMIPLIFDIMVDSVNELKMNDKISFIRISKEPIMPFISTKGVIGTFPFINIIKNIILNIFSVHDIKMLKKSNFTFGILWGLVTGGHMDEKRIKLLMPKMVKYAKKKNLCLEILFHPGIVDEKDYISEYIKDDVEAFFSESRNVEYNAILARDTYF